MMASRVVYAVALLVAACAGKEAQISGPRTATLDEARVARVAAEVDRTLLRGVVACRTLAGNVHVRSFAAGSEQPQRTLTVLRDMVTRAGADHASLVDVQGVVVASTDPQAVGYDFSEQPFLKGALAGQVAVFPSLGFAYERKRIFFVVPREPGAAVLRQDVSALERLLEGIPEPAALVYRERYAVATNRADATFDGFRGPPDTGPIDPGERSLFEMMDDIVPPIGDILEMDGTRHDVHRVPTALAGWQLIVCTPRG